MVELENVTLCARSSNPALFAFVTTLTLTIWRYPSAQRRSIQIWLKFRLISSLKFVSRFNLGRKYPPSLTKNLTAHILILYRTSRNEHCPRVYRSLTVVRTAGSSRHGCLQVLYHVNVFSTVRGKKGIYADPGMTRVQVS